MIRSIHPAMVFIIALVAFSCSDSSTGPGSAKIGTGSTPFTAYANPVMVAVNDNASVLVKGGMGPGMVTAISDSSVVMFISASYFTMWNGTANIPYTSITVKGLKTGTAILSLRDSAKSTTLQVTVNVAIIAASPASVTMHPQQQVWVSLAGGTNSYSISRGPNGAIATATFSSSNILAVTGVGSGTTDVIVKDNAVPAHTITIPVRVTPTPSFTTPGSFSFSSTKGEFAANGIFPAGGLQFAPTEGAGAGAIRLSTGFYGTSDLVVIYAFTMHSPTSMDIIAITTGVSQPPVPRTAPVTVSHSMTDSATVLFAFNGDPNASTADVYQLTMGSVEFTQWSDTHVAGKLSGSGLLTTEGGFNSGAPVTMTNGIFDVPQITDEITFVAGAAAPQRIAARMAERMVRKWYGLRLPVPLKEK